MQRWHGLFLSHLINEDEQLNDKSGGRERHLSLGGMAIETRLGCSIPPSLPMVVVDAELEIHEFAFELQGWLEGRGGDHGDEARNGRGQGIGGLRLRAPLSNKPDSEHEITAKWLTNLCSG
jgi:hypothetical protein